MLGVGVDVLSLDEATSRVLELLAERAETCRYVVTPNLDHAVLLDRNANFRSAYADAALCLADGTPLLWAARLAGQALPERVAGSDLGPRVLGAAPEGTRVFLLGGSEEASRRAAENVATRFSNVNVVGRASPPLGFERDPAISRSLVEQIRSSDAQLVIVGLGAPKQELWVHAHRDDLGGTVALCIGATIDFLAGTKKRAPRWMQENGLEWLHRAASEPRRLALRYAKDALALPRLWFKYRSSS